MYFKLTIGFLLFITITGSLSSDWETFKSDYNKEYDSLDEEIQRKKIFLENVNRMKEYRRTHPTATFTMGINHLTDRRTDELISASKSFSNLPSEEIEEPIHPKIIIPTWFDWRARNVITPVVNQSLIASSPAIVAVEVIESYQAIGGQNLTRGSVDQVVTCCGSVNDILDCVLNKTGGSICSQESYIPFNGTCNPSECQPLVTFTNVKKINPPKETTMLEWIQDSPLFVVIDASQLSFQTYKTGIYSESDCSKTEVNHALQLVGYGFRSGIPYWLCKNSWGEGWGERGYILIERGRNICGITSYVAQIGTKPNVNNAVRLMNFHIVYFVIFCLFVNLK